MLYGYLEIDLMCVRFSFNFLIILFDFLLRVHVVVVGTYV